MIKKLFGETEEQQFKYLQPRVIALCVGLIILLIGGGLFELGVPFGDEIGELGCGVCVVVLLLFGWAIMKGLFKFATLGSLFSDNFVIGIAIFVLFITIGYFGGFIVAFIGICRFLVLLKKRKGKN